MSGEITRYQPGNIDINRRGGQLGDDTGGSSGGQHGGGRDTPEVARLKAEIGKITRLAHSGKSKDEQQYRERQPELMQLMQRLAAAQGGSAVTTAGDAAITDASQIKNLPRDSNWRDAWADSKSELADVGLTPMQTEQLGAIVLRREMESRQQAEAATQQRRADSKRNLARLYGSNWQKEVERGNNLAKQLLPNDASKELMAERLADGSILGDHELICRLMIELARQ